MSNEITLANYTIFTKKQLQDFNESHGLARCDNETKEKTLKKTLSILNRCSIKLDNDMPAIFPYPEGKDKTALKAHILDFFATAVTNNTETLSQ
jgi:hypothetical protein